MLDVDDLVLAAIEASGGRIEGRTRLQKLVFFVSTLLDVDAGYRPHLYGPYSSVVSATAESQASRGVVRETVEEFPSTSGFAGHDDDFRRYVYVLTDEGRKALAWRAQRKPQEFSEAVRIAQLLVASGADYRLLSWAAKLYFVLRAEKQPLTYAAARERALHLGWNMAPAEVETGVDLLVKTGLVERNTPQ
jgi:uncharacterized protein YwgA